jgi:hypothetical protein
MNTAIAQHLNVTPSAILEVQEWARVLWVRVKGLGARFVSKKVVKKMIVEDRKVYSEDRSMYVVFEDDGVGLKGSVWASCEVYGLEDNTYGNIGYHSEYRPGNDIYQHNAPPEILSLMATFLDQAWAAWKVFDEAKQGQETADYIAESKRAESKKSFDLEREMYSPDGAYYG